MKILRAVKAVRSQLQNSRSRKGPVVLVPTMGALHTGHAELIRRARRLAGSRGSVVVSIFVNPTQFGPNEDFTKYPRPAREDTRLCRELGVDFLFMPSVAEMYAPDSSTFVDEQVLSTGLCGASRPGHFRGVCTVVAKLFLIVQPDIAVFGEKDYQQLAVIRRMVRDLNFPVRIVGVPTVRGDGGLALSSRNKYLSGDLVRRAPVLRGVLLRMAALVGQGSFTALELIRAGRVTLEREGGFRVDYLEIVDADSLQPVVRPAGEVVIAAAAYLGTTRLIDNIRAEGP